MAGIRTQSPHNLITVTRTGKGLTGYSPTAGYKHPKRLELWKFPSDTIQNMRQALTECRIARTLDALDEKEQKMVDYVITNPGASVELIGEKTGQPVSSVQKRLSRLFKDSLIERTIRVVDWAAVGYPLSYLVNIRVNLRALQARHVEGGEPKVNSTKSLANHIMGSLSMQYRGKLIVQDVSILLGSPADLCVSLRARDHHAVLDFVTSGLRRLGVVESTATFHAAWSCADGDLGDT